MKIAHLFTLVLISVPSLAASNPRVYFKYGIVGDIGCEDLLKELQVNRPKSDYLAKKEIMLEAREFTESLQAEWDRTGYKLLDRAIEIVGRPYYRKEITVNTTACVFGSMSAPLTVSVRRGLTKVRKSPLELFNFLESSFHELLHVYLSSTFDTEKSKILASRKFKSKSALFKNHLHLMALLHKTFEQEGRRDLMDRAQEAYVKYAQGAYGESWAIGTSAEWRDKLIAEIRKYSGNTDKKWPFDEKY